MSIIELNHINVNFKNSQKESIPAIKDVSLKIPTGQIFGIIGYSGAGKSTLVRTINLLQRPTSGSVLFNQTELTNLKPAALRQARQKIGMIFQHFNLMDSMTVRENILLPLQETTLTPPQKAAKVDVLLNQVNLTDLADQYPRQLSGGQKQRVAIARALVNDPDILISDEATSALDPKTTYQILQLLKELNAKYHLTIVLITHELEVVTALAQNVAIMAAGEIIETGPTQQIFNNPQTSFTQELIQYSKINPAWEVTDV
ncbi:D-methionine ABC superfamily ATP binding cassette transporter, ABC protein [Weissella kandleri]|uniref:D-methionine ABC superfamily ATP binding cassette transporter, ABC protein n=1 Tax=Weissella kandleri TaxID=1616 RepID=A0A0R2JD11_9LACO|nr:methionine ABC transporter ATP-binding protein [Weissella kandleri]KRN75225.1 D-methionine ABC superfamily ATP binding cassette transporter, ABC protein [Weissella kandleri]